MFKSVVFLLSKRLGNVQRRPKSCFISTPIYYVNASPHIGHLYSSLLADASYRFHLLNEPETRPKNCILSTGTDEHGTKVQQSASAQQMPLDRYCDKISAEYKALFDSFGINYTHFIRTTDNFHKEKLKWFWELLVSRGFISEGVYSGWYCDADEAFLTEAQLTQITSNDGKLIKVSAESGRAVHWVEESNYKFDLPKVKDDLKHWINSKNSVKPEKFRRWLITWIEEGVADREISVSRPMSRVHWGTPVPSDPSQTIYVWLDALVNYLSVGHPKSWPPTLQIIGKDILKFHGIYWPSFLIAAGLEPPQLLSVHSHWTVDGEKMSKSRGNVVHPSNVANEVTVEGLRYFLLREGTLHSDCNFTETKLHRVLNSELADTLGNLLSRSCGVNLNKNQVFPEFVREDFENIIAVVGGEELRQKLENLQEEVGNHFKELDFYKGIASTISALHCANKFFENAKPWTEKNNERKLNSILHLGLESCRMAAIALSPIIPQLSKGILDKLGVSAGNRKWVDLRPSWSESNSTNSMHSKTLSNSKFILYRRLQHAQ